MRIIFYLALLCPCFSMCQPLSINGKIINEDMEPVPGATVVLKRTGQTTISDKSGAFYLTNLQLHDTLLITAVGYAPATEVLQFTSRDRLTIVLTRKTAALDDVMVMAYGTTTVRYNTGNVARVSAQEITRQPVLNPMAALEGRVSGLTIVQNNGTPGSSFNILIRGQSSLLQSSDPLFILDGIPFAPGNEKLNLISNATGTYGISPFNFINPANIESIEVLKDADATSIYGSRGANGVVLITTKKGKGGTNNLSVNYRTNFSNATRGVPMLNTHQYLAMRREAFANDGITPSITTAPDMLLWDTTRYTDFHQLFLSGSAATHDFSVSLNSGSGPLRFLLSGAYNQESTIYPGNVAVRRSSLHASLSHQPADGRWQASVTTLFSSNVHALQKADMAMYSKMAPHLALYDSLGNLNWKAGNMPLGAMGLTNPLAGLYQTYDGNFQNLNTSTTFSCRIVKNLTLRSAQSFSLSWGDEHSGFPSAALDPNTGQKPFAEFGKSTSSTWIIEPQLEYVLHRLNTKINLLAGATFQQLVSKGMALNAQDYTSDLLLNALSGGSRVIAQNSFSKYNYAAAFARANLLWKNNYLLNISARRDGSSRFGPANRFSNFGAAGAGWIFAGHDAVLKNVNWLSFGKVRGSYGTSGNDQIGDYRFLNTWTPGATYQGAAVLSPSQLQNPNLAWESNTKLEAAIELGFFRDKLLLTTAWYRNRSGNQLVSYTLPIQTGFSSVLKNFDALIQNKGFEFTASLRGIHLGQLYWASSFNLSLPTNKLISFDGIEASSYASVYNVGYSLSTRKVYQYTGVDAETGIYTFSDIDKNGVMDNMDRIMFVNTDAVFYGGFQNSFSYKDFQLDVFLQFKKQNGRNYLATQGAYIPGYYFYNQPVLVLDRWQKPGDVSSVQRFVATASSDGFRAAQTYLPNSDAIYSDASFIRIKNVALSYSLPSQLLEKLRLTKAALSLQAQNIFTITGYLGGDPENQNIYATPPLRTVAAAVSITF